MRIPHVRWTRKGWTVPRDLAIDLMDLTSLSPQLLLPNMDFTRLIVRRRETPDNANAVNCVVNILAW